MKILFSFILLATLICRVSSAQVSEDSSIDLTEECLNGIKKYTELPNGLTLKYSAERFLPDYDKGTWMEERVVTKNDVDLSTSTDGTIRLALAEYEHQTQFEDRLSKSYFAKRIYANQKTVMSVTRDLKNTQNPPRYDAWLGAPTFPILPCLSADTVKVALGASSHDELDWYTLFTNCDLEAKSVNVDARALVQLEGVHAERGTFRALLDPVNGYLPVEFETRRLADDLAGRDGKIASRFFGAAPPGYEPFEEFACRVHGITYSKHFDRMVVDTLVEETGKSPFNYKSQIKLVSVKKSPRLSEKISIPGERIPNGTPGNVVGDQQYYEFHDGEILKIIDEKTLQSIDGINVTRSDWSPFWKWFWIAIRCVLLIALVGFVMKVYLKRRDGK